MEDDSDGQEQPSIANLHEKIAKMVRDANLTSQNRAGAPRPSETIRLIKAFLQISDPKTRLQCLDYVQRMADEK